MSHFSPETTAQAEDRRTGYLAWGIILLFVGGMIMGAAWPTTEPGICFDSSGYCPPETSGGGPGFVVGILLAAIGQVLAAIGLIATGVKYGVQSAHFRPAARAPRAAKRFFLKR
ncbi:hypothetical protein [Nocardioides abyssi]|uniref:Uncharacterized protein n=1 Tax=Nocardioides abyssi TaxID=3058370 RepID=A0ABT8ESH2_9ACTN|nr:hypothetical protein [Nocardioides abyssi]MDN4161093.1 hypothetical protein [Nocardioides abyssi]